MSRDSGPVPSRWIGCPRKSDVIAEKFIGFKTPLSERFDDKIPIEHSFPPNMIFGYVKTLKLKLGLWIDLTNSKRYYPRESVESKGAQYVKLNCRGHGETPSKDQTHSFIKFVDNFINDRPLDIIGVHCTHGFNRTGFLIVSYMVERLDCSVDAALRAFALARPPGIYKGDYIKELYKRYEDENDAPPPPEMPIWSLEYDDSEQGLQPTTNSQQNPGPSSSTLDDDDCVTENGNFDTGNDHGSTDVDSGKKTKTKMINQNATFMDGVSGVVLVQDQPRLEELQKKVQKMCGWESRGFPGCQPVSMDNNNLKHLGAKPYRVSWKADGMRYMMLINQKKEVFFFDRNHSCFEVINATFPRRDNLKDHISDTLLDGEMVIDKFQGKCYPRFLIYDIVRFQNENIGELPFYPTRLEYIKNEIIEPRRMAIEKRIVNRNAESFSIREKEFWDITSSSALLGESFTRSLAHEPDGLIFQPSEDPYTTGPSPFVLKWKPITMNSVDFRLKITKECGPGIVPKTIGLLYVGQRDAPFDKIKYTANLKDFNNKIIECKYENKRWVFMRERTDKVYPNSYNTVIAVCNSISNPVTENILLEYIKLYRYNSDKKLMPPPHKRIRTMDNNYSTEGEHSEYRY